MASATTTARPAGAKPVPHEHPPDGAVVTVHLVQFSTGAASAEVAWRVAAERGAENVVLLTADTLAEDDDNWRFAKEVAARLGCEWVDPRRRPDADAGRP